MLYLQLPPSDGALANTLKENLLAKMFEEHLGFLHACEALKIPKARALAELKVDTVFATAVADAREMLVEFWREEAVELADKATGREDTPAYTLAVKTRLRIASEELPRLRHSPAPAAPLHLHQHQGDTFILSEERRAELQAQRERLLIGRRDRLSSNVECLTSNGSKNERKSEVPPAPVGGEGPRSETPVAPQTFTTRPK